MELVKVCFFVSRRILLLRFNSVSSPRSVARELLVKVYTETKNPRPDGSNTLGRKKGRTRHCVLLARS